MKPLISLLYATRGRPEQCKQRISEWLDLSYLKDKNKVELILCIGSDEKELYKNTIEKIKQIPIIKIIYNDRPRLGQVNYDILANTYSTAITSWNDCAKASSGHWLMVIADDLIPVENWFEKHEKFLSLFKWNGLTVFCPESENARGLISHPLMSRALYEKLGNILPPKYIHSFCDNDLWVMAKCNGFWSLLPDELKSNHFNPLLDNKAKWDSVYAEAYRKQSNEYGERIFNRELVEYHRRFGKEKFVELTEGKINLVVENDEITEIVDTLTKRANSFSPSVLIAQPKRRKEDEIAQHFIDNKYVVLPFGLMIQYASVHGKIVDQARNQLIDHAISVNAKYLIFIDDDVALPRDGLGMLIQTAERLKGESVVGGVCTIKGTSTPAISTIDSEDRLITPD